MERFAGVFAPIVTPFDSGDAIDEAALRRNIARWLDTPLTGLVVLGSTGEAPQLDDEEADRVIRVAREVVPPGRPLVAGTGRESTKATIAATRRAAAAGADAVLVRTPGFFKAQMTSDVLVRHYLDVADVSPVPVLLYNVTMFTGVTLAASAVERLAVHPNIAGLKESGSDLAHLAECVARTPDDFTVLAGSAATFLHALCAGCDGGVLALAALIPDVCARMPGLVRQQRLDEARACQRQILPLARAMSAYGVPGLKVALDVMGYAGGPPRAPLRPAPPGVLDAMRRHLEEAGVKGEYVVTSQ